MTASVWLMERERGKNIYLCSFNIFSKCTELLTTIIVRHAVFYIYIFFRFYEGKFKTKEQIKMEQYINRVSKCKAIHESLKMQFATDLHYFN